MSRFMSSRFKTLEPYVPGEQPSGQTYIKLNTNESPFSMTGDVIEKAVRLARPYRLYSDTQCTELRSALSRVYCVPPGRIMVTGGSDEALDLAFMAFCSDDVPALFPDITYGFYKVYACVNRLPFEEIPLRDDFSLALSDYAGKRGTVFLANPNAPTGIALSLDKIEEFLFSRPDDVLVVDEAYVDFGAESSVPLVAKYPNLAVIQTFSKSRSLAGARLGFVIANEELIQDLNTLRFSTNPYDVNSFTQALGAAVLEKEEATRKNCLTIQQNRAWTVEMLSRLGFKVLPSLSNFVFARSDRIDGEALYLALKEHGILVRHFNHPRIRDYNRITIGTMNDMKSLENALKTILA
ncbi:MAG: aminotransferase class I/II-fold pyridoxal phosphate-dependent enzyme [Clostridiales bacterium]|nr:aminotransferase class I/II-fold pyridoxal phosphate-dependent enzyme [Clostridiales bacterium]